MVIVNSGVSGIVSASKNISNNFTTSNTNMTVPELASLAGKCLEVVKDELKNRDMPVAILFLGLTERVISAMGGKSTIGPNNSSLIIQPNMCDWDDPEYRTVR